ncbi:MAG: hypothetical protein MZU95_07320 [Desulfomicrobium escambiense]|nr:hypothetical protein [Desulfomicrobium escambiense]
MLRKVSCPLDKLEKVYDRLQEEKQVLARALDKAKGMLTLPWENQRIGYKTLSFVLLPGFLPEMAVPALKALIESDPSRDRVCSHPLRGGARGNYPGLRS